jgi:hypothetical protein
LKGLDHRDEGLNVFVWASVQLFRCF